MLLHRHFEEQISDCKNRLMDMGNTAKTMIEKAIQDLLARSTENHDPICTLENKVNTLQIEIDELVINILALQHPVATDLRMVLMCSKIASELERIGDQAVNISQNTAYAIQSPAVDFDAHIARMANSVTRMLQDSLQSFVNLDSNIAQTVLEMDNEVDSLKDQILKDLITRMTTESSFVPSAMPLVLISRNLERVGDHATNIAEEAIYVMQGRDVRHHNPN